MHSSIQFIDHQDGMLHMHTSILSAHSAYCVRVGNLYAGNILPIAQQQFKFLSDRYPPKAAGSLASPKID